MTQKTVTTTTEGETINKIITSQTPISNPQMDTQVISTERYWVNENGIHTINFIDFDLTKDNIFSTNEVGETLFKLYDDDGNNVIDNVEYEQRFVVTIKPIEKSTVVYYDYDGDGKSDEAKYTYETFRRDTQLSRFDENKNGLSAREFTNLHFNIVDVNNDNMIDLKEWQGTYVSSIDAANKQKALLNK